jgi:hypothetical protein
MNACLANGCACQTRIHFEEGGQSPVFREKSLQLSSYNLLSIQKIACVLFVGVDATNNTQAILE